MEIKIVLLERKIDYLLLIQICLQLLLPTRHKNSF